MSRKLGFTLGFAVVLASLVGRMGVAAPPDETPKGKVDALEKQRADLQKAEEAIAARLREIQQQLRDAQKQQGELQRKLEALRQQEQSLRQEAEKAREKEYVARVEVKGRLQRGTQGPGYGNPIPNAWTVTVKGLTYELDFGGNKEFLELAAKLDGKTVVVTGTLSGRQHPGWMYPYPYWQNYYGQFLTNPTTSTLQLPNLLHQQQPGSTTGFWNPYPYPYPYYPMPTPVLSVATFKAAD